jgi:hypothetical protein
MVNYISAIAIPVEDVGNPSLALKEYTDVGYAIVNDMYTDLKETIQRLPNQLQR